MTRFRHEIQPQQPAVTSDGLRRLQLALEAQIVAAGAAGVTTFNSRSGAVTFVLADFLAAAGIATLTGQGGKSLVVDAGGSTFVLVTGYLPVSIVDLPLADPAEPLFRWRLPVAVTISGSSADANVAATSPSALRIRKNGLANGTVTFTGTSGVFVITSGAYGAGDLFELYPPTSIDATLDQVSITFSIL